MVGFLPLGLAVVFLHFVGERRRDLRRAARVWLLVCLILMMFDRQQAERDVVVKPFESPAVQSLAQALMESRIDAERL